MVSLSKKVLIFNPLILSKRRVTKVIIAAADKMEENFLSNVENFLIPEFLTFPDFYLFLGKKPTFRTLD